LLRSRAVLFNAHNTARKMMLNSKFQKEKKDDKNKKRNREKAHYDCTDLLRSRACGGSAAISAAQ
jgi:hypothetical protein